MKKYLRLLLPFFYWLSASPVFAQQEQLLFTGKSGTMSVNAQYREPDGTMVSAATVQDTSLPWASMLVFKSDRSGNVLWSYKDALHNSGDRMRIRKARNGDYLVMEGNQSRLMTRLRPDGTVRWMSSVGFSSSLAHAITGFTELPDGNIVVCGYNDPDYSSTTRQYQGFLVFFDSAGTVLRCNYYGHTKTSVDDNYSFYDVTCFNDKLYVAGGFGRFSYSVIDNGLLMVMDLNGNLQQTRLLGTPLVSGTDTLRSHCFYDISVAGGQLYLNGRDQYYGSTQLIARVDTGTLSVSGYTLSPKPYPGIGSAGFFVNDSNDIYSVLTPGSPYYGNKMFITKIRKDTVTYCKKIEQDSLMWVNSFFSVHDTAYVGGRTDGFFNARGYAAYFFLPDPGKGCGMSDTTVAFHTFAATMNPPVYAPYTSGEYVSSYPYHTWIAHCVHSLYRCGDVVCPSSVKVDLDTPVKTVICLGDTALLMADGCYPKKWYRDGVALDSRDDFFKATKPGTYLVIVTNDACADTSAVITIRNKFIASITQSGDTLFSSPPGLSYQWLDGTRKVISGATGPYFIPIVSGTYYVQVTDSSGCAQLSDSFAFVPPLSLQPGLRMNDKLLEVFPNPASTHLNVRNSTGQAAMLSIKDITGRTLKTWQQDPGLQEYELTQLGLNTGIYWIQLVSGPLFAAEKIIVFE